MMLNDAKGNMYSFVNKTWNTVKGKCSHGCHYCFMKRFGEQKPVHFEAKELKTDLGSGNFIFVGSSCDMWAEGILPRWIQQTLEVCICQERDNRFLFQTKNPARFNNWSFPDKTTFGTTIETNRKYPQMGNAPDVMVRARWIQEMSDRFETMVTIEPIFDFSIEHLIPIIRMCRPKWVNIGADSGGHNLPEPPKEKVLDLISELRKFTEVKPKKNLKRILGRTWGEFPK